MPEKEKPPAMRVDSYCAEMKKAEEKMDFAQIFFRFTITKGYLTREDLHCILPLGGEEDRVELCRIFDIQNLDADYFPP